MAPTDGFHVVVKVLAGNHLPRPDKLLDHVCRTCGCLSSTTMTTTTTCRRLWVRSPRRWEQSPFKREQRGVRPNAASQSQAVPSRGRVLDPPHPQPPILLTTPLLRHPEITELKCWRKSSSCSRLRGLDEKFTGKHFFPRKILNAYSINFVFFVIVCITLLLLNLRILEKKIKTNITIQHNCAQCFFSD